MAISKISGSSNCRCISWPHCFPGPVSPVWRPAVGSWQLCHASITAPDESVKGMMSSETVIITFTIYWIKSGCYKSCIHTRVGFCLVAISTVKHHDGQWHHCLWIWGSVSPSLLLTTVPAAVFHCRPSHVVLTWISNSLTVHRKLSPDNHWQTSLCQVWKRPSLCTTCAWLSFVQPHMHKTTLANEPRKLSSENCVSKRHDCEKQWPTGK